MSAPSAEHVRDPEIVQAIERGMELFNAQEFFEAHEIWEEAWGESQMDERHLLQGLIQVAAAFYKLQLGMPTGTVKLMEKSLTHLTVIPSDLYGLNLTAIIESAREWESRAKKMVEQWRTDFDKTTLPRLEYRSDATH